MFIYMIITILFFEGVGDFLTEDLSSAVNAVWKESRLSQLKISDLIQQMLIDLRKEFSLCLLTNGNSIVQSEKIEVSAREN